MIRGKNIKYTVKDIAEGFTVVNPIFLKPLDAEILKELYHELNTGMVEIRREAFPTSDIQGIRMRNLRLGRLHSASMVLRNYARSKRILLV